MIVESQSGGPDEHKRRHSVVGFGAVDLGTFLSNPEEASEAGRMRSSDVDVVDPAMSIASFQKWEASMAEAALREEREMRGGSPTQDTAPASSPTSLAPLAILDAPMRVRQSVSHDTRTTNRKKSTVGGQTGRAGTSGVRSSTEQSPSMMSDRDLTAIAAAKRRASMRIGVDAGQASGTQPAQRSPAKSGSAADAILAHSLRTLAPLRNTPSPVMLSMSPVSPKSPTLDFTELSQPPAVARANTGMPFNHGGLLDPSMATIIHQRRTTTGNHQFKDSRTLSPLRGPLSPTSPLELPQATVSQGRRRSGAGAVVGKTEESPSLVRIGSTFGAAALTATASVKMQRRASTGTAAGPGASDAKAFDPLQIMLGASADSMPAVSGLLYDLPLQRDPLAGRSSTETVNPGSIRKNRDECVKDPWEVVHEGTSKAALSFKNVEDLLVCMPRGCTAEATIVPEPTALNTASPFSAQAAKARSVSGNVCSSGEALLFLPSSGPTFVVSPSNVATLRMAAFSDGSHVPTEFKSTPVH